MATNINVIPEVNVIPYSKMLQKAQELARDLMTHNSHAVGDNNDSQMIVQSVTNPVVNFCTSNNFVLRKNCMTYFDAVISVLSSIVIN